MINAKQIADIDSAELDVQNKQMILSTTIDMQALLRLLEEELEQKMSAKSAFICEKCGLEQMYVIASHKSEKGFIRRRKKCGNCGHRITTYEFHKDNFGKLEV